MKIYNKIKYAGLALVFFFASCNDYLTVIPGTQLISETAIVDIDGAYTALYGVYDGLQASSSYGCQMFTFADLRGGDMQSTAVGDSRTYPIYTFNNRTPDNGPAGLWATPYAILNRVNNLITAMEADKVKDGTQAQRNEVLGQAYTLRALLHFDLVKIHGTPYLKSTTDPGAIIVDRVIGAAEQLQRSTVGETYEFVVSNLQKALPLLETSKAKKNGYVNYWATEALLARVYLYMGEWSNAYTAATDVINNGPYKLITNANYIASWGLDFTDESIFSVVNTTTDNPSREALSNVSFPDGYGEIILSYSILDLLEEDMDDVRLQLINPDKISKKQGGYRHGYCKKYPGRNGDIFTNNLPLIRLSELYLIAAETALKKAPKEQNKADEYLDAIRRRANPAVAFVPASDITIRNERRKELVHEGHRFFDIMRLGEVVVRNSGRDFLNIDQVITISWDEHLCVLPVPRHEIDANPNILPTPGYTH